MFTVLILTYGDHQPLAQRCLKSIIASADWSLIADVRIGCNAVTEATVAYLQDAQLNVQAPCWLVHERRGANVGKYPLMRRMLYDPEHPITTPYVMWFDDDSYIKPGQTSAWWRKMADAAIRHDIIGKRYRIALNGNQRRAVTSQPWYTARAWPLLPKPVSFCQGGWWAARYAELKRWNYPFPELYHNGGDVILGALSYQQMWRWYDTNEGVAINADEHGLESRSKRRGLTTKPLWHDYVPGRQPDLSHHDFEHRFSPGNTLAIRRPLDRPDA